MTFPNVAVSDDDLGGKPLLFIDVLILRSGLT